MIFIRRMEWENAENGFRLFASNPQDRLYNINVWSGSNKNELDGINYSTQKPHEEGMIIKLKASIYIFFASFNNFFRLKFHFGEG